MLPAWGPGASPCCSASFSPAVQAAAASQLHPWTLPPLPPPLTHDGASGIPTLRSQAMLVVRGLTTWGFRCIRCNVRTSLVAFPSPCPYLCRVVLAGNQPPRQAPLVRGAGLVWHRGARRRPTAGPRRRRAGCASPVDVPWGSISASFCASVSLSVMRLDSQGNLMNIVKRRGGYSGPGL